tara:strand:- start:268 stop:780 length:513 start_codon:yes stop_codon:yes gene_type:complete
VALSNDKGESQEEQSNPLTISDLTVKEIIELVKYGFTTIFVCTIVFVIPYLMFTGTFAFFGLDFSADSDSGSKWFSIVMSLVVIYMIVQEFSSVCDKLSEMFAYLSTVTKNMSFLKRLLLIIGLWLYFYLWKVAPELVFFITMLFIIPAAFTFDKYISMLNEKQTLKSKE